MCLGLRLELDEAGLVYQPGLPFSATALEHVFLQVEPGERVGIAGPVGSGKSSLLELLAGITPPTSGQVLHDGQPVGRAGPKPGTIGLSFQAPENCLFENTVAADVAFGPGRLGLDKEEVARRVRSALEATGLDESFEQRHPFSLSGGEQRRVGLAGVLALEPRALFLDEPTAYLDPAARLDLIDRLVELNEESGATVVMVGHDMDELSRFAQRLLILDAGRMVADGPAPGLLADAGLLRDHGLEPPGTVTLAGLISRAASLPVEPFLTEEQAVEALARIMEGR